MHDTDPIEGVIQTIYKLVVEHGKKVLFYTNGGCCTREATW